MAINEDKNLVYGNRSSNETTEKKQTTEQVRQNWKREQYDVAGTLNTSGLIFRAGIAGGNVAATVAGLNSAATWTGVNFSTAYTGYSRTSSVVAKSVTQTYTGNSNRFARNYGNDELVDIGGGRRLTITKPPTLDIAIADGAFGVTAVPGSQWLPVTDENPRPTGTGASGVKIGLNGPTSDFLGIDESDPLYRRVEQDNISIGDYFAARPDELKQWDSGLWAPIDDQVLSKYAPTVLDIPEVKKHLKLMDRENMKKAFNEFIPKKGIPYLDRDSENAAWGTVTELGEAADVGKVAELGGSTRLQVNSGGLHQIQIRGSGGRTFAFGRGQTTNFHRITDVYLDGHLEVLNRHEKHVKNVQVYHYECGKDKKNLVSYQYEGGFVQRLVNVDRGSGKFENKSDAWIGMWKDGSGPSGGASQKGATIQVEAENLSFCAGPVADRSAAGKGGKASKITMSEAEIVASAKNIKMDCEKFENTADELKFHAENSFSLASRSVSLETAETGGVRINSENISIKGGSVLIEGSRVSFR